jgi:hypothetical protein
MAVTRETLKLLDGMRVAVGAHVDDVTRTLVGAWARAWDVLAASWRHAIDDVMAEVEDGKWPSRSTIDKLDRAQRALAATRAQVLALGDLAGVTVVQVLPTVARQAADWQRLLIESSLPTAEDLADSKVSIGIEFNRLDPRALDTIVRRTTEQITSDLRPLARDATEAMRRRLVQGIALGRNPQVAAARMLTDVQGNFAGGLARALNVARTEMLDAHRFATRATNLANPKVVTGWYWMCAMDERTCPSCWAQHGTLHPPEERGPDDHQSGRCAGVPATTPWSDLGFDIPEPASLLPDAESTFYALPESKQLQIMGRARLDALTTGKAQWGDLSVRRSSAGWRDSYAVRPVKDLVR